MMKTLFAVGCLSLGLLAGCNQCEKLTASICADLGAEACAVWKSIDGPDQVVPIGRRPNRACSQVRSNDTAYQGLLLAARGAVLAERLQRAVRANDTELQRAISAELAKHAEAAKALAGK